MMYLETGTTPTVVIGPFVGPADGDTDVTGLTTAYTSVFLSKNGGDLTVKHETTALAHAGAAAAATSLGYYHCLLDATDTDTLGSLKLIVHVATGMHVWEDFMVVTHDAYQSLCGDHVIAAAAIASYDAPTKTEMDSAFTAIKGATWAATDTLEAIVDDVAAVHTHAGAADTATVLMQKLMLNKVVTDPATGVISIYADNGTDVLYVAALWEDVAGSVAFTGDAAVRRDRLVAP